MSESVPSFNFTAHSVPNFSSVAVKFIYNVVPLVCELFATEFDAFVFVVLLFWTAYLREEHRQQR